ncbi:MAG: hypothetical protein OXI66_04310, partial [Boseongicola sp.]|nr:hypothetical protein [Boseongicola sp.]
AVARGRQLLEREVVRDAPVEFVKQMLLSISSLARLADFGACICNGMVFQQVPRSVPERGRDFTLYQGRFAMARDAVFRPGIRL